MEFKDYLKTCRLQSNLTQSQLARLLECSQSAVSSWERGVNLPNYGFWKRFRSVFRIPDELAGAARRRRESASYSERAVAVSKLVAPGGIVTLKRLRLSEGLTRAEFALRLGVSEKTVVNWEREGIPHLKEIQWIVSHFNIALSELN